MQVFFNYLLIKTRLFSLLDYIRTELAPCEGRAFVDSAPLLEKALAKEFDLTERELVEAGFPKDMELFTRG